MECCWPGPSDSWCLRVWLGAQVTISLLDKAMADSGKDRFLIDGFPRNEENRAAFEKQVPACHPWHPLAGWHGAVPEAGHAWTSLPG